MQPDAFFMDFINNQQTYSYWEIKQYFKPFDLVVVGAGIVGLSTAISFKKNNPRAKILVLERSVLPNGASTKNAGFACFGTVGELLDDLQKMSPEIVWETVKMRWEGLQLLRERLKDRNLGFQSHGGFELFRESSDYEQCVAQISVLNKEIKKTIGLKNCFQVWPENHLFRHVNGMIFNTFEGQIDTSLMMMNLLKLARKNDIEVLNNTEVFELTETSSYVELRSNVGEFKARNVVVATNGFAKSLLKIVDVEPARAQVLVTKPIKNLKVRGTYHFSQGYYYFRDIDNRILFGGGRNLDFNGETTPLQGLNPTIQNELDRLLTEMILPDTPFEVEHRWSGIMGVGKEKKPIIRRFGKNIVAAVRMGGMGIAIGSLVGEKTASEIG